MTFCAYLLYLLCPRLWLWFVFIVSLFLDLNNDRFVSRFAKVNYEPCTFKTTGPALSTDMLASQIIANFKPLITFV